MDYATKWARTAEPGEYLVLWEDYPEDALCGLDQPTIDDVRAKLKTRGMRLWGDDKGLRAVAI